MRKVTKRLIIAVLIAAAVVFYIGNYTLIHKDKVKSVYVTAKEEADGHYYITAGEKRLLIKDENLWNVIDKETAYDIEYEWYSDNVPEITKIAVHGKEGTKKESH